MDARQGFGVRRSAVVGAALAAIIGLVAADPAQAEFIFTLERLSDTQVRLTGSGSVGTTAFDVYSDLELRGVDLTARVRPDPRIVPTRLAGGERLPRFYGHP